MEKIGFGATGLVALGRPDHGFLVFKKLKIYE
jgi:hypothetical protein